MTEIRRCPVDKCGAILYPILRGEACTRCGYRLETPLCPDCGDTGVAFDHEDRQIACACLTAVV